MNFKSSNHSLYMIKLRFVPAILRETSELLDGSISLSPLHSSLTIDVRIATSFHHPLASPYSSVVHHLSGPTKYALTRALNRVG